MFVSDTETAFHRFLIISFCFVMIVFFRVFLPNISYCLSVRCDYEIVSIIFN